MDVVINSMVIGAVNLLFFAAFFYLVTRREGMRDGTVLRLQTRVDNIEREEIGELKAGLRKAALSRKDIYERMQDKMASKGDIRAKVEADDRRFGNIERQISGINVRLEELNSQTSESRAILHLIAQRLNITLGGKEPGSGA